MSFAICFGRQSHRIGTNQPTIAHHGLKRGSLRGREGSRAPDGISGGRARSRSRRRRTRSSDDELSRVVRVEVSADTSSPATRRFISRISSQSETIARMSVAMTTISATTAQHARPASGSAPVSVALDGCTSRRSLSARPDALVAELAEARIGRTFNQYADGPRAPLLRERLLDYLETRVAARSCSSARRPGIAGPASPASRSRRSAS